MSATFLTLSPEFGGTRFGPFGPGSVGLGSDASQCTVVLSPQTGVQPVHAWLTVTGSGWVLQPAVTGAAIFVSQGGREFQPVGSQAQLSPGDAFVLAHAQGVRFILEVGPMPAADSGVAGPRHRGRRPPTAGDMAREVRRQAGVSAMTHGPLAEISKLFFRARSGALFQPRYVVGALIAVGGLAVTGCAGLVTALTQIL